MSQNLEQIRDKYLSDLSQVKDYIQYLESFFLSAIKDNASFVEYSKILFADSTIDTVFLENALIRDEIESFVRVKQSAANMLPFKSRREDLSIPGEDTPEGEVLKYLCEQIRTGIYQQKKLFEVAHSYIEFLCITKGELMGGECFHEMYDSEEKVMSLIDIAREYEGSKQYEKMQQSILSACNSQKALSLFDLDNQLNIYRQCFIQAMAYFDSCIFDILECCMEEEFFAWLPHFENKSIKTHEMAEHGSFDAFQSSHIQSVLKNCYVKDLLTILNTKDVEIFMIDGINRFSVIMEMINRRNIHIHRNGIVDDAYLKKFNIYGASLGNYLRIDKPYLFDMFDVTTEIVKYIATTF